ncbi:MAG: TetR/AcrR family transcriptional regulator [Hyphomicrobiales bacterium]|nr:TetR/AcrR family transcriptional regulator [Hyphomicrobiales bacterium]
MASEKVQGRIIDALMALAAEKAWDKISLDDVAKRAKVDLAALRRSFDSKFAILEALAARVDAEVLGDLDEEMAEEVARERLFDVLMRRFEALQPYKEGLRSVHAALTSDPLFLAAWNRIAVTSQTWMLTAAGIGSEGIAGLLRAQGLVFAYARAFRTWLDDDDPGLARTMAALDKGLREGERWLQRAADMARVVAPVMRLCRGQGHRGDRAPAEDQAAEVGAAN